MKPNLPAIAKAFRVTLIMAFAFAASVPPGEKASYLLLIYSFVLTWHVLHLAFYKENS